MFTVSDNFIHTHTYEMFEEQKDGCNKKRWTVTSVDKDLEKLESSFIADGNVKWYILAFLQKVKYRVTI